MKEKNKTLLDLDRAPTLDELRTCFRENDFSAAAYMDIDYEKLDTGTVEALEYIKGMMDEKWEPLSRKMGLKSDSAYYGKDNPLIAIRDNMENLVASGVLKLLEDHPERAAEILSEFADDPNIEQNANAFLRNAVETLMQVMNYEEAAKIVQSTPAYEDFNHEKKNNYRARDFDRKWNHTRSGIQISSLDEMKETVNSEGESMAHQVPDTLSDVFDEVVSKITQETFWNSISVEDKKLLHMRMNGMSQKEIAESLGYKTHSAVTKRLQKLKELFSHCA
jgi:hypothetical protein